MNIPAINPAQLINPTSSIQPIEAFLQRQPQLDKTQWKDSYQLDAMSLIQIVDSPSTKKVFKIQLTILDKLSQKYFNKTVFFGQLDDYCFTKSRAERGKRISQLKCTHNILHPDYWRYQICLSGEDWIQNFQKISLHYLKKKGEVLNRLKPKKDFSALIKKRLTSTKQRGGDDQKK